MAASSAGAEKLFASFSNDDAVRTDDIPKIDIELYLQNYKGRIRYDRLMCIARTSTALCVDALKAAVSEAKKGNDVERYSAAVQMLQTADPSASEAFLDRTYVETTSKENEAKTARLEAELKTYKNNLVKDSIRMGNEDLGKHLESCGRLIEAGEVYGRMRPDIVTAKQGIELGRHLASIAVQLKQWASVTGNLNKTIGLQSSADQKAYHSYVKVMHGLSQLGLGKRVEAASSFLQINALEGAETYEEFVSPNDIAVYGGLLALATMDRAELQRRVLDSTSFRPLIELEPRIRQAISHFVSGKYSTCLTVLETYRPEVMIDIFLQKHVKHIYDQIRQKCVVQYLKPFSCITLASLSAAFSPPGQSIEDELVGMIKSGALDARIDAINQVVTTVKADPRAQMQAAALKTAEAYEKEALGRARRMGIKAAGLEVQGKKGYNEFTGGII